MAKSSLSQAQSPGKLEPHATTLEGIPEELYDIIIGLAISASPTSVHTMTVACANRNETNLVADVEMMGKLLHINHRSKQTISRMIFNKSMKNTTQIISTAVIDNLIKTRLYPPFHKEAQNLEVAVDLLKHFAYPKLSGCFQAGNMVSLCFPNLKSIRTTLSHWNDALFGMRPEISSCTEDAKRFYVAKMVNRMVEGHRSFLCSFIFGITDYERVVKLECRYRQRGRSELVRNMSTH